MLEFFCPNCGSRLGLDDRYAGRRARCPKCTEIIAVPTISLPSSVPEAQLADEPLLPKLTEIGAEIGRTRGEIGQAAGEIGSRIGEVAREERDAFKTGLQSAAEQTRAAVSEEVRDARVAVNQAMRQREDAIKQQIAAAKERAKQRVQEKAKAAAPSALRTCFGCLVALGVIGGFLGLVFFKVVDRRKEAMQEDMEREMQRANEESPGGPSVQLPQRSGPLTSNEDRLIGELFRRLSHPSVDTRNDAMQRLRTLIRRDRFGMFERLKTEFERNEEPTFVRSAGELLFTDLGEEGQDFAVELAGNHVDAIEYISGLVEAAQTQTEPDQVRRAIDRMEQATRGGKAHGTVVVAKDELK